MRLIDADKLDMSVKVDGDRTLSPISQLIAQTIIENAQTIESDEDCISRQAVLDMAEDITDQFGNKHKVVTKGLISMLPPVTPKAKIDVLDKIRAEIKKELGVCPLSEIEGLKHALEIIDKYKTKSEDKE